jgi:hypothetical protein
MDKREMSSRMLSGLALAVCLLPFAGMAMAGFPDVIVDWMEGPPMLNGKPSYTAVHAEARMKAFDPQTAQTGGSANEASPWVSVVPNLQPFASAVDRVSLKIYWRKDFFDACPASSPCDFYGEVFSFNDQVVHLRTESFPVFGAPIDDGKTWDIRIDKFRLVSNSRNGRDNFPGGQGRIWAPVHISSSWKVSQIFDTLACLSLEAFAHGRCQMYQKTFKEDSVSLEILSDFSTVFDGEAAGYAADPEFKHFDRAIVITQIMGNGTARERYFLAGKLDRPAGTFQSYGFVRWDDSVRDEAGKFVTIARTVGLKRATDKQVTFGGMRTRGGEDSYAGSAGVRILHDDGDAYPSDAQTKPCPGTLKSIGSIHEPEAVPGHAGPELEDLSGYSARSGGWIGICYAPSKTNVAFTLADGCPDRQQRGTFYVKEADVKKRMTGLDKDLVRVAGTWVVLCAARQNDWHAYFSLASEGCDADGITAGTIQAFQGCIDAKGRRCDSHSNSMALCVAK